MLEQIDDAAPAHWIHAAAWARRMRRWARQCARIVVQTPRNVDRAVAVLGVERAVCVVVANGFDAGLFAPRTVDRGRFWRQALVEEPKGWRPGAEPGSVAYEPGQVAIRPRHHPVAVGRYTAVKRLGLLIEAFALAERRARQEPALVLLGGLSGRMRGRASVGCRPADRRPKRVPRRLARPLHPLQLPQRHRRASARIRWWAVRSGARRGDGLRLPAIAVNRLGPAEIIDDGRTGWLVRPDDRDELADTIVCALDDDPERLRRGRAAHSTATARWGWRALAVLMARALDEARRTAITHSPV